MLSPLRFAVLFSALALSAFSQTPTPTPLPGSGPELEHDLPVGFHRLQLGEAAPDFHLKGIDERFYSLADFKEHRFLLVVFLSNHCPFSHAAETRLIPWVKKMKENGLGVVAIQPNHPDAVALDELDFGKYGDSFEEMKLYAAEKGFPFPYLNDGETQEVSKTYGALATPDLFLFDAQRKLVYSGRFDDSRFENEKTVSRHDAIDALDALLAGRPVTNPTTRPHGCAVKWKTKIAAAAERNRTPWDHVPVTLEKIDAAGVAKLVKNPTAKWRLVNVWATWCVPCVQEFSELAKLSRRLKSRDFELITISLDQPKDEAKSLKFLQGHHAGMPSRIAATVQQEGRTTNNYLYSEDSTDPLVAALDPQWPGPIPHTVLIAPGGEIVWRHNGPVDPVELSRLLLDKLGGYWSEQ